MPAAIDVVLDQHAGALRAGPSGRPARRRDRPRAGDRAAAARGLRAARPLRLILTQPLDDARSRSCSRWSQRRARRRPRPARCAAGPAVLVAADRVVRARAAMRGWTPVVAPGAGAGRRARRAARLRAPGGRARRDPRLPGLVPYWIEAPADGPAWALAALTPRALAARDRRAASVAEPVAATSRSRTRCSCSSTRARASARRWRATRCCGPTQPRVLLALGADQPNDEIPAHGAHGHFRFLTPSPELLRAGARARACRRPAARGREPAGRRPSRRR